LRGHGRFWAHESAARLEVPRLITDQTELREARANLRCGEHLMVDAECPGGLDRRLQEVGLAMVTRPRAGRRQDEDALLVRMSRPVSCSMARHS
jgi:uncharacterized membrane-anchored protein